MTFNKVEQEVIVLNAVWTMIDGMVNFAHFLPLQDRTRDITLIPRTGDTLRMFHLLVGDFLSQLSRRGSKELPFDLPSPPSGARKSDLTFLFYLRGVFEQPNLNPHSNVLRNSVECFAAWLEQRSHVEDVWLPSVGLKVTLDVERITWIKICADIAKHNFARLEPNVGKIVSLLKKQGKEVDEGMGYAVLPDFWYWFHTNLFAYHASTIAEFLNEIRWSIFKYLQPEFVRAYSVTGHISEAEIYKFVIPSAICAPLARHMYWDLMNMVLSGPSFPRFTVTPYLKKRY